MHIADLQTEAWTTAENKGFHDDRPGNNRDDALVRLALVHSEVSEAIQRVKRHWPTAGVRGDLTLGDELADILIRVADLAECCGIPLEHCVLEKLEANKLRPRLYGTAKEGA